MYSYNKYPFSFAFYSVKEKEIGRLWLKLRFCPVWFYSVHSVLYSPLQFYSVHIQSILSTLVLFDSIQFYSVHFGLIRPTLVLFGLLWFYSVHLFYLVHSVHFSPMWPTSITIQSNVVHSVLFCSLLFHLVLFYPLLGFLYFFLLFLGIETGPRNMFMEREVVRDKVGGIYIMTYIYKHILN